MYYPVLGYARRKAGGGAYSAMDSLTVRSIQCELGHIEKKKDEDEDEDEGEGEEAEE
jgi:hypothetical protein